MYFDLVDRVLELSDDRAVTIKLVSAAEEYLRDHFPGFPVLPGVLMIEAAVQAARCMLERRAGGRRLVLGAVRGLKYGRFVRPGDSLRMEVTLLRELGEGSYEIKAEGRVAHPSGPVPAEPAAVSGRLVMREVRLERGAAGAEGMMATPDGAGAPSGGTA